MEEKKLEDKKKKVYAWFSDRFNLYLIGVMVVAFLVRLYYFFITKDQAHWWDTLAYASLAKESIYHLWTGTNFIVSESIIRAPLLPFLWGLLMRLGVSEVGVILILEFIPSLISIYLIYLIGTELYNKKVGMISAFLTSFLWIHIFYSARIMTDIPSITLGLLSTYFFLKSYKNFNIKLFSLSIIFLCLAFFMRNVAALLGFIYILFLFFEHKFNFIKNKKFWIGGLIGIIPLLLFFGYNFISEGNPFPAIGSYAESAAAKPAPAYYVIYEFFPHILGNVLSSDSGYPVYGSILILLLVVGLVSILIELFLGYDLIFKSDRLKAHIFTLITALVSLIFFIFIIKAAEDRYLMVFLISILFVISEGILFIYEKIKIYNRGISVAFIVVILLLSAYSQFNYGDPIIVSKVPSYYNLKQAFIWINENTPRDSVILGDGIDPYVIYYGERKFLHFNQTNLGSEVNNSDYIVIASFEHQSQESANYVNTVLLPTGRVSIEEVFFFDEAKTQPSAIVYKINK